MTVSGPTFAVGLAWFSSFLIVSLASSGVATWLSTCFPDLKVVITFTCSYLWVGVEELPILNCPFGLGIGSRTSLFLLPSLDWLVGQFALLYWQQNFLALVCLFCLSWWHSSTLDWFCSLLVWMFEVCLPVKSLLQDIVLDEQEVELGMMADTNFELEWNYLLY